MSGHTAVGVPALLKIRSARLVKIQSARTRLVQEIPDHGSDVAAAMGAGHSLLCVSSRSAQNHLHSQRHRGHAYAAQEDRQESRPLPQRRSCHQATLSGLVQHRERLKDATDYMEAGSQSVRHPVRRTLHECAALRLFNPTSAHKTLDTSHPAPRIRIARRRISVAEDLHLHAPGTLIRRFHARFHPHSFTKTQYI